MIGGKTVLAVIPARGGSKRCPRKNEKPFKGYPLLAWTIWAAYDSEYLDAIFVSTEDKAIAGVARWYGAHVIERPESLATDESTNEDVLRHALSLYPHDYVVLLQPTSPLRTGEDIDTCLILAEFGTVISTRSDGSKNGAVYVATSEWLKTNDFGNEFIKYKMPDERSLDIDYAHQF